MTDKNSKAGAATLVTFAFSRKVVPWDPKHSSLLELAEAHGIAPDFSCRSGICGTCACELVSGQLEYFIEPLDPPEDGMALICCSRPVGDVTLKL